MAQLLLPSPIGPILLRGEEDRLDSIRIGGDCDGDADGTALLREAAAQLTAWFEGRLTRFDLPLASLESPRGAAHRDAILAIPFGETASYGALARTIGSSARAVGQACRRNPFPIVVPCHRVIAAGGAIGYYSGGEGIATKLWLLAQERRVAAREG
jgi:methylated-DNA-[protein]-cysteine S-methyltransferase